MIGKTAAQPRAEIAWRAVWKKAPSESRGPHGKGFEPKMGIKGEGMLAWILLAICTVGLAVWFGLFLYLAVGIVLGVMFGVLGGGLGFLLWGCICPSAWMNEMWAAR